MDTNKNRSPIAARVAGLRPTAVNTVLSEVKAVQATGRALVSLMRGQPDTPTPEPIVEAACRALRDGRTGYADQQGEPALRQAVAAKLARDNGLTYDPANEILVTDGATCGIATALATLIEPGDEVLVPDPIYDAYRSPIALWGGVAVGVPATIDGGRFAIERAAWTARITARTRRRPTQHALEPGRHRVHGRGARGRRRAGRGVRPDHSQRRDLRGPGLRRPAARLARRAGRAGPGADGAGQQPVEDLCDDRLAGRLRGHDGRSVEGNAARLAAVEPWAGHLRPGCGRRGASRATRSGCGRSRPSIRPDATGWSSGCGAIPGVEPLVPEGGLFVMVDVRGLGRSSDEVRRLLAPRRGSRRHPRRRLWAGGRGDPAGLVRRGGRDPGARPGEAARGADGAGTINASPSLTI